MDIEIVDCTVHVRLALYEKLGSLHGDVAIPIDEIESASVDPDPMASIRGRFKVGIRIPGIRYVCTTDRWRHFWALSGRGPALSLTRRRGTPRWVTVTAPNADELVQEIASLQ